MLPAPNLFKDVLPIAAAAAAGGTLRHLATACSSTPRQALIRVATVNIVGSFLLGTTHSLKASKILSPRVSLAVATGFCGGFTTFSTFASGALDAGSADIVTAATYVITSCVLGIAAVAAGRKFGTRISL